MLSRGEFCNFVENITNMLQFITDPTSQRPITEQVKEAIAGGCRWIELSEYTDKRLTDKNADLRQVAEELMPVCRDAEVFLMIDNDVELVAELHNHGVHLASADRSAAMKVRELLGAHAVIGVGCVLASDAIALRGTDVDYVTFAVEPTEAGIAAFAKIAAEVKAADTGLHIVARGEFSPEQLPAVLAAGASGVAISTSIAAADDPRKAVEEILEALS